MNICCDKRELKIEGDVGADPFWCDKCGSNIDIVDIPVSPRLQKDLLSWATQYGEWIDWGEDMLLPNGIQLENQFNLLGKILTEKVKEELGDTYTIIFTPSKSARYYAKSQPGSDRH